MTPELTKTADRVIAYAEHLAMHAACIAELAQYGDEDGRALEKSVNVLLKSAADLIEMSLKTFKFDSLTDIALNRAITILRSKTRHAPTLQASAEPGGDTSLERRLSPPNLPGEK